jgi:SAM-dependent methyltransferase
VTSARAPKTHTDHYSYAVYADPAMAESFDARRFGGPIGRLVAASQERVLTAFLAPLDGQRILDVGTGTGRAAIILARGGAVVTGVDAADEMLAVARRRAADAHVSVTFDRADAHRLPYGDRSFDDVVCLRVLMHTPGWRESLGQLCRVARRRVVFDYPALASVAAVQAVARRIAQTAGANVEAYRVFRDRSVDAVLEANGFRARDRHRQFVLPIALHKRLGSADTTERLEGMLARLGLQRLIGSPVTVVAERCGS